MKRSTALALALAGGAASSMGISYTIMPRQQNCPPVNEQKVANAQQPANCSSTTYTVRPPYFLADRAVSDQATTRNYNAQQGSNYNNRPTKNVRTSWGGFGSSGRRFSGGFGG